MKLTAGKPHIKREGILVEPDEGNVADAISLLLQNPALAEMKGSAASRLVRTHHTAEIYTEFVESLYEHAVEAYNSA